MKRQAAHANQRGITLVEVVVVGILAAIVMVALTGFYIHSQGTWIDASSQALTQREVSIVLETIVSSVHASTGASVNSLTQTLILDSLGTEKRRFWLDTADSLIHEGSGVLDRGPIAGSKVTRFDIAADSFRVWVTPLEMRSANGRLVQMSTGAAFYSR